MWRRAADVPLSWTCEERLVEEMGNSTFWENLQRILDAEKRKIYGERKWQTLRVDLKTKGTLISLACQVPGGGAARNGARHLTLGWAAAPAAPLRFGAG